jgi:predicted ATPase
MKRLPTNRAFRLVKPQGSMSLGYVPTAYQMIHEIEIANFKCFKDLKIKDCKRMNIVVGDNGSGKTALLEAIFLALGGTSNLPLRYRQQRGMDTPHMRGSSAKLTEALLGDLFYRLDMTTSVSVDLHGTGEEARSVKIVRNVNSVTSATPLIFIWKDASGKERAVVPEISAAKIDFPDTGETLDDSFFFASNQTYSAVENAERFSILSRAKRQNNFVNVFTHEYGWIEDIGIEVLATAPALYASLTGLSDKLALPSVSGGINRFASILVAMAARPRSVILVDEIENGLYYKHHENYWKALLNNCREYECQLLLTTHSAEWLDALASAAGDKVSDIALWRAERGDNGQPEIFQFSGKTLKDGIEGGAEVRGGTE